MILLLSLLIATKSFESSEYLLIFNSETQKSLLSEIEKSLGPCLKFNLGQENHSKIDSFLGSSPSPILIDLTETPENFPFLDEISEKFETFYLTITQMSDLRYSKFRFFIRASLEVEKNSINELIFYLAWNKFSIFSTSGNYDLETASSVKSEFSERIEYFLTLPEESSSNYLGKITKKCIKASGVRKILLVGAGQTMARLQKSIQDHKLELPGSQFLFSPDSLYSAFLNGSVIVAYSGTENSTTDDEFKAGLIWGLLKRNQGKSWKVFLEKECENHVCTKELLVLNIQAGRRVKVGTVSGSVKITEVIVYPGNTLQKNDVVSSTPIVVSIANGTSDPNTNIKDETYAVPYKGAEFAVNRTNSLSEIPNFHLELFPTDCGNNYFNFSWYLKCFSQIQDQMGIVYLTSLSAVATFGNYITLKAMNKTIPQLAPFSLIEDLNNKTEYPELLKLGMSNFDYGESFLLLLLSFKWNSLIFFGSLDDAYYLQYKEYLKIIESINIRVVNPENLRLFPVNLTRSNLKDYDEYFQFAKNSKCRIYLFSTPYSALILEGLYDVGLRKEDVIVFSSISMYYSISLTNDEGLLKKVDEFHKGINIFSYEEWIGELGQQIYKEMLSVYSFDLSHLCITFDSISVIKASLLHLLELGEDYESNEIFLKSMRLQRLVGCMGTIYFLSDSNALATFRISIGQLSYNHLQGRYEMLPYVNLNKYDTQIIRYTKAIEWPDGSKVAPSNFIDFGTCNLDKRKIKPSDKARTVVISLASVYIFVSIIAAILSARYYVYKPEPLEKGKKIDIGDYISLFYILIHTFQLIALNNKDYINSRFSFILFLGMNWVSFKDLKFAQFWNMTTLNLFSTYIYIVFVFMKSLINERWFEKFYISSKLKDLMDILLPLYGHLFFVPVVSNMMSIFACSQGIGEQLEDSYMDRDCDTFCFTGNHAKFSVLAGLGLFFYIIISVIVRPSWQDQLSNLNINVKVTYYSILSVFQVMIVMTNAVLGMQNQDFAGVTAAVQVLLLIVATFANKPMNYQRGNVSLLTCLFLAFWCYLLSSCFQYTSNTTVILIIYFVVIAVILIVGLVFYRKAPNVFVSENKISMAKFIRGHFRSGTTDIGKDDNCIKSKYTDKSGKVKNGSESELPQLDRGSGATVVTSQAIENHDKSRNSN